MGQRPQLRLEALVVGRDSHSLFDAAAVAVLEEEVTLIAELLKHAEGQDDEGEVKSRA
jgi:hypothetical protein